MPGSHDGTGLISGGDWSGYHRLAVELSERIEIEGWSAWQLRPGEQAPAGLAAVIYTLTGIKKPWVLLPFNAAIHATAALVLLAIMLQLTGRLKTAFLAVLPFALFPTPFLWNSALHKDGIFILGSILVFFGFNLFIRTTDVKPLQLAVKAALAIIIGLFLVWVVRPYGLEMLLYIGFFVAFASTVYLFFHLNNNKKLIYNIVLLWFALVIMLPLTNTGIHHSYISGAGITTAVLIEPVAPLTSPQELAAPAITSEQPQPEAVLPATWVDTPWLPQQIDHLLYSISVLRDRYRILKPHAGSNIDVEVKFENAASVILYIPRAFQIGMFAPFPEHWFESGRSGFNTFLRRISGLEMLLIYFAYIFVLAAFKLWLKKPELYITLAIPTGMVITYALVVVNIGTLHRMRYGFVMTIVAVGIAAAAELYLQCRKRHVDAAKEGI